MTTCKVCGNRVSENFCSNCGNPAHLRRINKHYVSHEFLHLLHFEKGFFYSAKELLIRPGKSIREFLATNRNKHMKPLAYLILTSLLFALVAHYTHMDELYNEKDQLSFDSAGIEAIMKWATTHYGYSNIVMGAFIALFVKLLFRKYRYNFFEITVLLCFVMGQGMLLLSIETLFAGLMSQKTYQFILIVVSFSYPTWAIGQFFEGNKFINYLKAFFAYFLGYVAFYISIIPAGLLTDLIMSYL